MKKLALALARLSGALDRRSGARNGVAPKVTELGVSNPTTGLYVGNSYIVL